MNYQRLKRSDKMCCTICNVKRCAEFRQVTKLVNKLDKKLLFLNSKRSKHSTMIKKQHLKSSKSTRSTNSIWLQKCHQMVDSCTLKRPFYFIIIILYCIKSIELWLGNIIWWISIFLIDSVRSLIYCLR